MSARGKTASKACGRRCRTKLGRRALPQMRRLLLPGYSPHATRGPDNFARYAGARDRRFAVSA